MDFSQKLARWYLEHRRPLPWREHRNPYAIWLSEIILQQTRVEQGIPYYLRFLERFPTVRDLAEAPLEDVLPFWQGLGYYSRARNLHRAAQIIHADWNGAWRKKPEDWLKLPGVGPYTAGAVTSIAFGTRAAAVDGNVLRVLSRWMGYADPVDKPAGIRTLTAFAESLLPEGDCGDHTQALMELGSLVCTPTKPNCAQCPVSDGCQVAFRPAAAEALPVKQLKTKVLAEEWRRVLLLSGDRVVVYRRPNAGIWSGLYDLPTLEDILSWGISTEELVWQDPQLHLLSHRRLTLHFGTCCPDLPPALEAPFEWISEGELSSLPWPAPLRRWLEKNTTFD